jgi:hypothetical protein
MVPPFGCRIWAVVVVGKVAAGHVVNQDVDLGDCSIKAGRGIGWSQGICLQKRIVENYRKPLKRRKVAQFPRFLGAASFCARGLVIDLDAAAAEAFSLLAQKTNSNSARSSAVSRHLARSRV